ncbi:MAG: hypothetical protein OES47_00805 [Acidobacteriota bacterium]|nr:hypothetical protein [Acidobacteriota bacterium]
MSEETVGGSTEPVEVLEDARPSFELVPLDCPTCGAAVEASGVDVVFYCTACRNGYSFDIENNALEPVDVAFVAASHIAAHDYRPFWLLSAEVEIRRRGGGRGGDISGILGALLGSRSSDRRAMGAVDGTFAIPAFHSSLDSTIELVHRYTRALPELGERLGERLLGGCYGVDDAEKLAHFAVIASEVDKPDVLKQLDYRIRFGAARLLGVPFQLEGEVWRDAIYGIGV